MPGPTLNLVFAILAATAVLVMALLRTPRGPTFGVINIVAVSVWIGPLPAGMALLGSFALWAILRAAGRDGSPFHAGGFTVGLVLAMVGVFLVQKLRVYLPAGTPAAILQTGRLMGALGLSYAVLRAIDLVVAVGPGRVRLVSPLSCFGYLFPFTMLISGPIARYADHTRNDAEPCHALTLARALGGLNWITTGLVYKYVISEYLLIFYYGPGVPLGVESIADTAFLFVYIFFDFAGYSAIAVGIGKLLGVPTPANFRRPFAAASITDFFTRWHISLGAFVERNIYTPLQLTLVRRWGMERASQIALVSLSLSWIAVAWWHRLSPAFTLFGLGMTAVIWAEKIVRSRVQGLPPNVRSPLLAVWRIAGPVYTIGLVTGLLHIVMSEIIGP